MHLSLILGAIALAILIRLGWTPSEQPWMIRWQTTLFAFLLPPLVIITMVIAVLCMGTQGEMIGMPVGRVGYSLALGLIGIIAGTLIYRAWHGWRSLQQVKTYPAVIVQNRVGHLLDTSALFAAEIGFWTPELVISQGLLDALDSDHLDAVLTHERAHEQFRDTFWFFWLGWIKQLTQWLPRTDALWHELLLLRELRADAWAAQSVDPLLLAESLLHVVRSPLDVRPTSIAFDAATPMNRLEIRIEALLGEPQRHADTPSLMGLWWAIALFPLLTVFLHS